jgi:hypothetical protein
MARFNQKAQWVAGSLQFLGTTSNSEILIFDGDNIGIRPLTNRLDVTITGTSSAASAVLGAAANPLGKRLCVLGAFANITATATGASTGKLSIGIGASSNTRYTNIISSGIASSSEGVKGSTSPVVIGWTSGAILTVAVRSTAVRTRALRGTASIFYTVV